MSDNQFGIFAHGESFDPDAYIASSSLKFDGLWRKGEISADHPTSSGVYKELGDGLDIPLWQQERLAIEYLTTNRELLKDLAQHPAITTFIIGLQYRLESNSGIVGFSFGPSLVLMRHCLDIGIEPTYYVWIDRAQTEGQTLARGGVDDG